MPDFSDQLLILIILSVSAQIFSSDLSPYFYDQSVIPANALSIKHPDIQLPDAL